MQSRHLRFSVAAYMLQGWVYFFLVCLASGEEGPGQRPYVRKTPPPAGAVAPVGDLQEFPTAPAEGERTAEGRDRGQFEHRVRGRGVPQAVGFSAKRA